MQNFYNPYQTMYNPPMPDQLTQMRQAYQFPQAQQQQQQSGMVWVRNRFEAENYPVAPNTAVALWDMSGPYVHRKETDVSGRPVMKTYQLVEATDSQQAVNIPIGDYVTRQEFQTLADAVSAMTYHPKFAQKEETVNE